MRDRLVVRAALALGAALMLSIVAGGPAAADTPLGHSGTYGVHYLADSEEYAGARCHYANDTSNIDAISVRAPFVYSFSNDVDARTVGWQIIVQKNTGGDWTLVKKSTIQVANARTDRPAPFTRRGVSITADTSASYRALVRMFWYVGGKKLSQVGSATHRVDWYRYPVAEANPGFCPGFIF